MTTHNKTTFKDRLLAGDLVAFFVLTVGAILVAAAVAVPAYLMLRPTAEAPRVAPPVAANAAPVAPSTPPPPAVPSLGLGINFSTIQGRISSMTGEPWRSVRWMRDADKQTATSITWNGGSERAPWLDLMAEGNPDDIDHVIAMVTLDRQLDSPERTTEKLNALAEFASRFNSLEVDEINTWIGHCLDKLPHPDGFNLDRRGYGTYLLFGRSGDTAMALIRVRRLSK